jgi:hypothetical protein
MKEFIKECKELCEHRLMKEGFTTDEVILKLNKKKDKIIVRMKDIHCNLNRIYEICEECSLQMLGDVYLEIVKS